MQFRGTDGRQARTVEQVVKEREFDVLLITVIAITDSVLHHLPGALVPKPETMQDDGSFARHEPRYVRRVILSDCPVPGGRGGAGCDSGIVLSQSALLYLFKNMGF